MKIIAILLAVCVGGVFTISACDGALFLNKITGSGKIVTEKRALAAFEGVEALGAIEVIITAQQQFSVEVEADDNVMAHVVTTVSGGVLRIHTDENSISDATMRVRISLPLLKTVEVSGASKAEITGVRSEDLKVGVSGASSVRAEGTSRNVHGEVSGASSFIAENLNAENVEIEASGASKSHVRATESLEAEASGASTIYYSGEPKHLTQESTGASSIKQR